MQRSFKYSFSSFKYSFSPFKYSFSPEMTSPMTSHMIVFLTFTHFVLLHSCQPTTVWEASMSFKRRTPPVCHTVKWAEKATCYSSERSEHQQWPQPREQTSVPAALGASNGHRAWSVWSMGPGRNTCSPSCESTERCVKGTLHVRHGSVSREEISCTILIKTVISF